MLATGWVGRPALAAEGIVYDCDMSAPGGRGWISPRIMIGIESTETRAMVIDGIIHHVNDELPMLADVEPRSANSTRVMWTVSDVPVDGRPYGEEVSYIATIFKETGRIIVTAELQNADNQPRGEGTCKMDRRRIEF